MGLSFKLNQPEIKVDLVVRYKVVGFLDIFLGAVNCIKLDSWILLQKIIYYCVC